MDFLQSVPVTYATPVFYLLAFLWLAGLVLGSLSLGSAILRRLGFFFHRTGAAWLAGIGVGLAMLSYLVFLAAACQVLNALVLWGLMGAWFLAGGIWLYRRVRCSYELPDLGFGSVWGRAALVLFGVVAFLNLIPALTPSIDWDGLAYHLALPKIYLQHGGFVFRPDIFHNLLPQFTEMLFTTGLWLPYGIGSKLIHWSLGLLAAMGLWSLGRERGWRLGAGLVALVFYFQCLVHIESGTAFIDLAGAAYVSLAMLAFYYARTQTSQPRWLYLGVFFLGVTAATKWHGLAILELGLVLAFWFQVRMAEPKTRLRTVGWMLFWGHVPVLPYIVRAWVQGGNPVWPLGYGWFGGNGWSADMAQRFSTLMQQYATAHTGLVGWLRLPYDLLVHGETFGLGGADLRGPILAGLIVGGLAVWSRFRLRRLRMVAAESHAWDFWIWVGAGVSFVAFWFFSSPQVRFLLPLYPLGAWIAVETLQRLWLEHKGRSVRNLLAIAGVLLVAGHPPIHRSTLEQVKVLTGRLAPSGYITHEQAHYPACQWLNQHAQPGEKVLLFGENRGFYLDVPYLWGDPAMQCVVDFPTLKTPEALAARLEALGVKWLLVRNDVYGPEYLLPEYRERMLAAVQAYGRVVWLQAGVQVVYLHALGNSSE